MTGEVVWQAGWERLTRDTAFAPVAEQVGPPELSARAPSAFAHLVSSITHQQLAGAAARTIHGRVVQVLGPTVSPATVLAADPEALRGAGLSRSKLAAILDLATQASEGTVVLRDLYRLDDDAVVERLTRVRGIGPWTARMFLMFHLRRPDVWPSGDLGVRQGWARVHGLDTRPSAGELAGAAEHLRPWRSVAAWTCWRVLELDDPPGTTP